VAGGTVGSGGAGAVLVQGICTWLTTRGSDVTAPDGRQTTFDVKRADSGAVAREVLGWLSSDGTTAGGESG
jgi:hypothetical protein